MVQGFSDLADLPEDDRIRIIGRAAERTVVAFVTDDEPKADRYVAKLLARFKVREVGRGPGPVKGSFTVRVGPAES